MTTSSSQGHRRRRCLSLVFLCLMAAGANLGVVQSRLYNVGDLRCWGPPSSSNPHVYSAWTQTHRFKMGDSLMFLYPPSEDSVVQLSASAFETCDVSNPIQRMNDGNSLVNLTSAGLLYFASGEADRCNKQQKLVVEVHFANGSSSLPAASSPSYPMVAGVSGYPPSSAAGATPTGGGSWILILVAALLV